jgi:hypothetical protein
MILLPFGFGFCNYAQLCPINQPTNQPTNQSINQSTNQPVGEECVPPSSLPRGIISHHTATATSHVCTRAKKDAFFALLCKNLIDAGGTWRTWADGAGGRVKSLSSRMPRHTPGQQVGYRQITPSLGCTHSDEEGTRHARCIVDCTRARGHTSGSLHPTQGPAWAAQQPGRA